MQSLSVIKELQDHSAQWRIGERSSGKNGEEDLLTGMLRYLSSDSLGSVGHDNQNEAKKTSDMISKQASISISINSLAAQRSTPSPLDGC